MNRELKIINIRKLEEDDAKDLVKWLSNPTVLEYYEGRDNVFDMAKVQKKFYSYKPQKIRCIIEYNEKKIGYLQYYQLDNEDIRQFLQYDSKDICYGVDLFIGETDYWNMGIGTQVMKKITQYLCSERNVKYVMVDPQCRNPRAIKCYEKSGFEKIKIAENYELHEGKLENCCLMRYESRIQ